MRQIFFQIYKRELKATDQSFLEFSGLDAESIKARDFKEILKNVLNEEAADFFEEIVTNRIDYGHKNLFLSTENGRIHSYTLLGYRVSGEEGEVVVGVIIDRRRTSQSLDNTMGELAKLQYALTNAMILAITDIDGKILYANQKFCDVSGYSVEELIGQTHKIVNSGYHPIEFFEEMWETILAGKTWNGELKNKKKDGSFYWSDSTIIPVFDEKGRPFQFIAIRYNITDQKKNEERIREITSQDSLTGLLNRVIFDNRLALEVTLSESTKTKFGLIFLDLDSFNSINDTHGHSIGDKLLVQIASRLAQTVGEKGLVSRTGGDEFGILLLNIQTVDQLKYQANEIMAIFKAPFHVDTFTIHMTCSMGVVMYPESGKTHQEMMISANTAMNQVKTTRKNDYDISVSIQKNTSQRSFLIQNGLRAARYEEEFYLVYQPKVNPNDHQVSGLEALIRWNSSDLGEVMPGEFIPIAEEIGMLQELNEWVFDKVCRQIKEWMCKGYRPLPISINLSACQFTNKAFAENFLAKLQEFQVPTQWIDVEITESIFINNEKQVQEALNKLRRQGIHVALDDFGTGYSSLSYLIKLDLDMLKIDKSLIQGISNDFRERSVVNTVIQLGKDLGMKVVAEGIENQEELKILADSGVDEIQGYYYSRPRTVEYLEEIFLNPYVLAPKPK